MVKDPRQGREEEMVQNVQEFSKNSLHSAKKKASANDPEYINIYWDEWHE
ncbi:hypothetical protein WD019_08820 [Fictibacillus sp. Mic-4]|nr:hypothetical protein [Fictibacillus gelatini]